MASNDRPFLKSSRNIVFIIINRNNEGDNVRIIIWKVENTFANNYKN